MLEPRRNSSADGELFGSDWLTLPEQLHEASLARCKSRLYLRVFIDIGPTV